jgi:hypothetical protein
VFNPEAGLNPSDSQQDEDGFAAGIAAMLNNEVLERKRDDLIVFAPPRTLGELRKHITRRWRPSWPAKCRRIYRPSAADIEKRFRLHPRSGEDQPHSRCDSRVACGLAALNICSGGGGSG